MPSILLSQEAEHHNASASSIQEVAHNGSGASTQYTPAIMLGKYHLHKVLL